MTFPARSIIRLAEAAIASLLVTALIPATPSWSNFAGGSESAKAAFPTGATVRFLESVRSSNPGAVVTANIPDISAKTMRMIRKVARPTLACGSVPTGSSLTTSPGQPWILDYWFDYLYRKCGWLCFANPEFCPCTIIYF